MKMMYGMMKAEVTIKTLWQMKTMLSIGYGRVIGEHGLDIGSWSRFNMYTLVYYAFGYMLKPIMPSYV